MEKKLPPKSGLVLVLVVAIFLFIPGCDFLGDLVEGNKWEWSLLDYAPEQVFEYEVLFEDGEGTQKEGFLAIEIFNFNFNILDNYLIEEHEDEMSASVIDNSSDNQIPEGTILIYKTSEGSFGKLQVIDNNFTNHGWVFKFVTYNANGTVKASGENVELGGNYTFNLDTGEIAEGVSDFKLYNEDSTTREFRPLNGAEFFMIQEGNYSDYVMVGVFGELESESEVVYRGPEALLGNIDEVIQLLVFETGFALMGTDVAELISFFWDIGISRGFEETFELDGKELYVGFEEEFDFDIGNQKWVVSIPGLITLAGIDGFAMDITIKDLDTLEDLYYYNFYFSEDVPQPLRVYSEDIIEGNYRILTLTDFWN